MGIDFYINKLGFRGPEISEDKPPKTFRVFCLGDSITMGSGLPENILYPRVLEKMLREGYPHKNFEMINAGVSGYGIKEEAMMLEEEGLALSPDLVILQFCVNDVPGTTFSDFINPRRELFIPYKFFSSSIWHWRGFYRSDISALD